MSTVFGQAEAYSIRQYTNKNGLPQNSAQNLTFDKNGYLWIATQDGLCRFDGQNFYIYDKLNTPIFNTNRFSLIKKTENSEELELVDDLHKYFKLSANFKITNDNALNNSKYLALDFNNYFLYENLVQNPAWPKLNNINIIPTIDKYNLAILNTHECYGEINGKLYYLNNQEQIIKQLPTNYTRLQKIPIFFGHSLILPTKNGIVSFEKGEIRDLQLSMLAKTLINNITHHGGKCFNVDHNIFIMDGKAIYLTKTNSKGQEVSTKLIKQGANIDVSIVNDIQYNEETGIIYLGSGIEGLFVLYPSTISTMQMQENDPTRYNNAFYDLVSLSDSDLLNNSQIFNIYTKKTRVLDFLIFNGTLFRSSEGAIIFQKNKTDSIFTADKKATHFKFLRQIGSRFTCLEDSFHRIWAAFESTLYLMDKDAQFRKVIDTKKSVTLMFSYSKEVLWLLREDGLFEYNIKNGQLGAGPIFPNVSIRSIYRARDSSIWIGTYGNIFYKYQQGKFIVMPLDYMGALKNVHNFYEDDKGFFWMTTNNGLVQCLKSDLDAFIKDSSLKPYYYHYDQEDGMATNEFNGRGLSSYVMDKYNNLIYPSIKGAIYFSPLAMKPNTGKAHILIEDIILDNKKIDTTAALEIPYDFNQLKINIGYPYFGNQENLIIEYKVEGLQNDWYRLGVSKQLIFNRLPSGDYKLIIRKKDGFGANSYEYKHVRFSVIQRFYHTWWFYALFALAMIAKTSAIFKIKNRVLEKRKLLLEKQIAERTQELHSSIKQLNLTLDELYQSEKDLFDSNEVKERAIAVILHDIKAPIRYLNIAAMGFTSNIENLSKKEIADFSVTFAKTTQQTNLFVEELLQWMLAQKKDFKANYSEFPITGLLDEIKYLYKDIAGIHGNTVETTANHKNFTIKTDRNILKLIIRNLVDNAVKNTKDGKIILSAEKMLDSIKITIEDNGKGMTKAELEQIQQNDITTDKILKSDKMGLVMIRSFLKLINGELEIESKLGIGTHIKLYFENKDSNGKTIG